MKKLYIFLFIYLFSPKTFAQFSVAQKTLVDAGVVNNSISAIVHQPDGKIITTGSAQEGSSFKIALLRFDSTGTPDISFGNKGTDTFTVSKLLTASYAGAALRALALQGDGKIIAAGTAYPASNFYGNIFLMRFNVNGSIDSSFGSKGTAIFDLKSSSGASLDDAYGLAVQPDGKIVIAGTSYDLIQHRMVFMRLQANGKPDDLFGTNGVTMLDINHKDDEAFDIQLLSDGSMIGAGETYVSLHSYDAAVVKLTAAGLPDIRFGINGITTTRIGDGGDIIRKIAIQPNGSIVAAGTTQAASSQPTDVLVLRYKSDGSIDSSFALTGKKVINVGGLSDAANSLFIQPDNKILIGGYAQIDSVNNFLSLRLNKNGSFDSHFGTAGIATTSVYGQGDQAYSMILKSDGRFILGGRTDFGASKFFSLLQYKADGSTDNSFGASGKRITGIGSSEDAAYKMIRLPWDNSLLLCGTANDYWAMIKFKPNGSTQVDSSFGINGRVATLFGNRSSVGEDASPDVAVDSAFRKIYLAGLTPDPGQQNTHLAIVRFNSDGSTDNSFGNKGIAHYSATLFYGGLAVQSNHKVLLAGVDQNSTDLQFVARFNYDGTIDPSFGNNGRIMRLPMTGNALLTGSIDKHIYLSGLLPVGDFDEGVGIIALTPNGTIDSSFGVNGLAAAQIPEGSAEIFFKYPLTRDANGRFLVSGGIQDYNSFRYVFSVTRFTKTGKTDSSFGNNGVVVTDETNGSFHDSQNMGITSFGKGKNCEVITTGIKMNDFTQDSKLVVIAYKNDGSINPMAHTAKGYLDTTLFGDKQEGGFAALADDSDPAQTAIYIAGFADNGVTGDFMLVKFIKRNTVTSIEKAAVVADDFKMKVSPNPAHAFVNIEFNAANSGTVNVVLITANGNAVYNLVQQNVNEGVQQMKIALPSAVKPGLYFLKVTTRDGAHTQKMVIE